MISMNMIALRLCLRRKNIGVEGIKIVCDKLEENIEERLLVCI